MRMGEFAYCYLDKRFSVIQLSFFQTPLFLPKMSENSDSADLDAQERSFTRTIDEEVEMEEQAEREREEGHPEREEEEEDREQEVMTAGSKLLSCVPQQRLLQCGNSMAADGTFLRSFVCGQIIFACSFLQSCALPRC